MDNENKRIDIGIWLNTKGYELEITSDGLWWEDYDFTEHKTKEVLDLIIEWAEKCKNEAEKALHLPVVIERAFYAGRERLNHPDFDYIYEDFEEYKKKHVL